MSEVAAFVARSRWLPAAAGVGVVAVVARRLGTGPVVSGIHAVTGWSLALGAGITLLTTACSAWRWSLVARRFGVELAFAHAVAMYYRSQFLNTTLPGGVLGDVHRGVRQGQQVGDVARGLRAVGYERLAGQAVQVMVTAAVLIAVPSPLRSALTVVLGVGACGLLSVVIAVLSRRRSVSLPGAARAWIQVTLASALAVAGYTTMFVVAARVAGATAATERLLPLAMLVLVAMAVPTNVAGWGPREGVAAWVFGFAGFGSAMGLTTATVYGVMTIVGCAPGGVVLLVERLRRAKADHRRLDAPSVARRRWSAVAAQAKGGLSG